MKLNKQHLMTLLNLVIRQRIYLATLGDRANPQYVERLGEIESFFVTQLSAALGDSADVVTREANAVSVYADRGKGR